MRMRTSLHRHTHQLRKSQNIFYNTPNPISAKTTRSSSLRHEPAYAEGRSHYRIYPYLYQTGNIGHPPVDTFENQSQFLLSSISLNRIALIPILISVYLKSYHQSVVRRYNAHLGIQTLITLQGRTRERPTAQTRLKPYMQGAQKRKNKGKHTQS